ncbi:hypothetical protein Goshw_004708 [Gossypium schwendimanii]|uniref:RNase H type-1 domain-containing protein n=1 Tax=Gossypium schwendimanii TaxID=34291 RepID=A0A7J9MRQ5_GOSSC|nr:hypothetical protein [Gossypium schwendimanii]
MYKKIFGIRREINSICPRCGIEKETLIHAMKNCPRAQAVLVYGGLNNNLLEGSYFQCVDWIEDVARMLDKKALFDLITKPKVTWERVAALSQDFCIFNLLEKPVLLKSIVEKVWKKPGQGVVKINFDATANGRKMSFGLVARDHDGFVLNGRVGVMDKNVKGEWAKLHALEESISFSQTKNWLKLEFESNCISLVNRLNRTKADFSTMGHRIREIFKLLDLFSSVSFVWASRCCNKVVDYLCNWAIVNNCTKDFNMDYPSEVQDIILRDAIN